MTPKAAVRGYLGEVLGGALEINTRVPLGPEIVR